MTYNTLSAAKGTPGAIATWVNYSRLDTPTIIDEAQSLLYGEARLRTREMMTDMVFTMVPGSASLALPARFLDPIGRIRVTTFNNYIRHKDSGYIEGARNYTETNGSLGANPFTTTNGSNSVNVTLTAHNFNANSPFYTTGATAFNNVTIAGTFPITAIVDANNFTIDISILNATPNASGSGGGSAATYICDSLTPGTPLFFGIWNEQLKFDQAFFQTSLCRLQYFQSLPLLTANNGTNFLTNRYPQLMRVACMAQAADFMKDTEEYNKQFGRLQTMIEKISNENDMSLRGLELEADTP